MAHPTGESESDALRVDFDRRLMLQFRGSVVTSDAGLLAYRELDDALGLSVMAGEMLADARTGKNGRHALVGLLRQSVFGRLAGYARACVMGSYSESEKASQHREMPSNAVAALLLSGRDRPSF
jgi:hypothetical protein